MVNDIQVLELYRVIETISFTCETCYLHKPGNYTKEDCVTYGKRLCGQDKLNISKLEAVLAEESQQASYQPGCEEAEMLQ